MEEHFARVVPKEELRILCLSQESCWAQSLGEEGKMRRLCPSPPPPPLLFHGRSLQLIVLNEEEEEEEADGGGGGGGGSGYLPTLLFSGGDRPRPYVGVCSAHCGGGGAKDLTSGHISLRGETAAGLFVKKKACVKTMCWRVYS